MRIFKFAKADFLMCYRKMGIMLAFPAFIIIIVLFGNDNLAGELSAVFTLLYCLFAGIILSSLPFQEVSSEYQGFLRMLPARDGDPVRGHFLFSFLLLVLCTLLSILTICVEILIKPSVSFDQAWLFPLFWGGALLMACIENSAMCFFHTDSVQALQIVRMLPGFIYFFGIMFALEKTPSFIPKLLSLLTPVNCIIAMAVCIIIFIAVAEICTRITLRRD